MLFGPRILCRTLQRKRTHKKSNLMLVLFWCATVQRLCKTNETSENCDALKHGPSRKTQIRRNSEAVGSTQRKWLFKTAKPLFIGSIPIAASNNPCTYLSAFLLLTLRESTKKMDSREESRDGNSVRGLLRYRINWIGCK